MILLMDLMFLLNVPLYIMSTIDAITRVSLSARDSFVSPQQNGKGESIRRNSSPPIQFNRIGLQSSRLDVIMGQK